MNIAIVTSLRHARDASKNLKIATFFLLFGVSIAVTLAVVLGPISKASQASVETAVFSSFEGESMTFGKFASIAAKADASGGYALRFGDSGTAKKQLTTSQNATQAVVHARRSSVSTGRVSIRLYVDGVQQGSERWLTDSWSEQTFNVSVPAGTHSVNVRGGNLSGANALYVDRVQLLRPALPPQEAATTPPETAIQGWVDNDSTNPIDEDGNGSETTRLSYSVTNADGAQYSLNGGAWATAGASPASITVPANGLENTVRLRATRSSDGVVDSTPAEARMTMCPRAGCSAQPPSGGDNVLVGAGDIASGYNQNDEATARVLDGIEGTVYTTGDNVYESGTAAEYSSYYTPTWGRHKARTKPTPGNHEYGTSGAAGYFGYFSVPSYYSYTINGWQVVALNSNVPMASGSPQYEWLKGELANSTAACQVAYFHHPLFSSGSHGNNPGVKPLWDLLYADRGELVLNGHDHDYERFAPQNPSGQADANGIREFVVGTGGKSLYGWGTVKANSEKRLNDRYGVLKLTLNPGSYGWEFVDTAGTVADSGTGQCVT